MTRLLYIANIRLPTEKAHGLQIMQNCEALAEAGAQVMLWAARRRNSPELKAIRDVWVHYGVRQTFAIRWLPNLDLLPLVTNRTDWLARLIFYLQQITFVVTAMATAPFAHAGIIYSRDALILLALSFVPGRRRLIYEAHALARSRASRWLQRWTTRRCSLVVAVTRRLAEDLIAQGAPAGHVMVAHDGIRRERFANLPTQGEVRAQMGWPAEAFVVGYAGRLHTMSIDKGVILLVDALSQVEGVHLGLIGGPDDMVDDLRRQWMAKGMPANHFWAAGQIPPNRVPAALAALDVCAMPFPWNAHFAHHASPMKLFEYMASHRPIVASDLPATTEVVQDGETALLYPPGDSEALAQAIRRLRDDGALREKLSDRAYQVVMERYTWDARARAILARIAETVG